MKKNRDGKSTNMAQAQGDTMKRRVKSCIDIHEGFLFTDEVKYFTPNDCVCGCDPNKSWRPRFIWRLERDNGCAFSPYFEDLLRHLAGRNIRITIEELT